MNRKPLMPLLLIPLIGLTGPIAILYLGGCTSHCTNGVRDGDETAVDCGGSCGPCAAGRACVQDADCESQRCSSSGYCAAIPAPPFKAGQTPDLSAAPEPSPTSKCADGIRDGLETDIDCGGPYCPPCAGGLSCLINSNCASQFCVHFICLPIACHDGKIDGMETDIDCGGPVCVACAESRHCLVAGDCIFFDCVHAICDHCHDGIRNKDETDIDCGGADCAKCGEGKVCYQNSDCQSNACFPGQGEAGTCLPAGCGDKIRDGQETDVDCGGPICAPCYFGQHCRVLDDCVTWESPEGFTKLCTNGVCSCPPGYRPDVGSVCTCDLKTCPSCCDDTGSCGPVFREFEIMCNPGPGKSCVDCGTPIGHPACDPWGNCARSCYQFNSCSADQCCADGACIPGGKDDRFCGANAAKCVACPNGTHCVKGVCK